MVFLEKIKSDLRDYFEEMNRDRHSYLLPQVKLFGIAWKVMQGADGCRPVQTQATILMEKSPPPISKEISLPSKIAMSANAMLVDKNAGDIDRGKPIFPDLESKKEYGRSVAESNEKEECPRIPPFDMLDLPQAMNALGFKYAARCADKWFKGDAHEIADGPGGAELPQYVDAETLKIGWLLKFGAVKDRYEHLLSAKKTKEKSQNIYSDSAKKELIEKLSKFMARRHDLCPNVLNAWDSCNEDIQELHKNFQFQFTSVSMLDVLGDKWSVAGNELKGVSPMNDLAASLANFNFYAAIARARFSTAQSMHYETNPWKVRFHTTVEVTHVFVYAKDVYSFNDKKDVSQYLGHWNRHGVIVAYDVYAAEKLKLKVEDESRSYLPPIPMNLEKPVDVGNGLKDREVFYPVRNRDFRNWRSLKNRGGDFLIFSDLAVIELPVPIILDLGAIEKDYVP